MDHATRLARFHQTDLYVVITQSFCNGRAALEVLDAILKAGVDIVQLREKDLSDEDLYRQAVEFRKRTADAGALLIIDDRIDVALACHADGVHLGQTDLPMAAARCIAPDLILGASSHNLEEALAAQAAGASYVNIGPIFPTQTKTVSTGAVGLDMIDAIKPHLTVPFTCMGGIKVTNAADVVARGARHIAVVTAVTAADDVVGAARQLRTVIKQENVQ